VQLYNLSHSFLPQFCTPCIVVVSPSCTLNNGNYVMCYQWRRYTRATPAQITWLEDPPLWLRPAYCFASVIVWTENKIVTISDRFKNGRQVFLWKNCTAEKILATPMLPRRCPQSWLRPWLRVTWLEYLMTSKWPGSFTALAPPMSTTVLAQFCTPCISGGVAVLHSYPLWITVFM